MDRAFPGASMLFEIVLLCRAVPFMKMEVESPRALRFFNLEEISLQFKVLLDVKELSPEALMIFDGERDSSESFRKDVISPSEELSAVSSGYSFKYSRFPDRDRDAAGASGYSSCCRFLESLYLFPNC